MATSWTWVPDKAVGPFVFGDPAAPLIAAYQMELLEPDSVIADWETYAIPGTDSNLYVRNGTIDSVLCGSRCEYAGVNLVGLTESELQRVLGAEDSREDNEELGYSLIYYDRLGGTFWVEEGVVRTATCQAIIRD